MARTPAAPPVVPEKPLDRLAQLVGAPNEELRVALFRRVPNEALIEHGTRVESQLILDDVAPFVEAGLGELKKMGAEQRALVKLPPGLFALLVDETRVLAKLKVDHDAMIAAGVGATSEGREAQVQRKMREGLSLRNVSYQALRNVLGREAMREIDGAVVASDTPEKLAAGLEALAGVITKLLEGDALDRLLASEFGLDAAFSAKLGGEAAALRAIAALPPPPDRIVTQRMLDLQDGRVLHLIAIVIRAFRAAHKADESIAPPGLEAIGWLFDAKPPPSRA